MRKLLTALLCLFMVLNVAGAHPGHGHGEMEGPEEKEEQEEKNELAGLIDEYPSSAVFLGALELTLGIILVVLSYIHYSRNRSS